MKEKVFKTLELDKILNQLSHMAVMEPAREMLLSIKPYTDVSSVITALDETDEARLISVRHGMPPISPLSDIGGAIKRTKIGASLSCSELLMLAHTLRISRNVIKYCDIRDFSADYPLLNLLVSSLFQSRQTEQRIFDCILSEDEIDDNASEHLSSIRRKKMSLSNKVKDILNDIIHSPAYATALRDPIISMRGDRYVVPVKSEYKSSFPGVVHDTSSSGGTMFIEPLKVVETNNAIRELAAEEKEEIERILAELTAMVAVNADDILDNYRILTKIDFIFAKARYADKLEASKPKINCSNIIDIKKGRHPLLDKNTVVPINIHLGQDFDTLVITGPNTGGKTVSLKTLGLFTLMAQCGLHVPCSEGSSIAVFNKVFADIGDEQSIEQSLSTFSSHMKNIVEILNEADSHSLVLFDELGAGTDPAEGAALASAILRNVRSKGAITAATTHYSEIKMFAITTDGVENAAMEFDVDSLRPTYRLYIGALGKSCAFEIAKRLGVSDAVIDDAKKLQDGESKKFEDIVNTLEENRIKAEKELEAAEQNKKEADKLRERLNAEHENTAKKKEKILEDARREAKKILADARLDIDRRIKEIEEAAKNADKVDSLRRLKGDITKKVSEIDDKLFTDTFRTHRRLQISDLEIGFTVFMPAMNNKAVVSSMPDKNGNLEVSVGGLKIKTNIKALEEAPHEEPKKKPQKTVVTGASSKAMKSEIDVRGMILDDALAAIDKYIDDAAMSHLNAVTIIHGRGTGVLKSGVSSYLRTNKSVKAWRLGKYGEGGDGVTIVELK